MKKRKIIITFGAWQKTDKENELPFFFMSSSLGDSIVKRDPILIQGIPYVFSEKPGLSKQKCWFLDWRIFLII